MQTIDSADQAEYAKYLPADIHIAQVVEKAPVIPSGGIL
jgi:hypothetical protein